MIRDLMTPERKQEIDERWTAIDRGLADLADGKVVPEVDDLARHEGELLDEQESLEFELGVDYFKARDAGDEAN